MLWTYSLHLSANQRLYQHHGDNELSCLTDIMYTRKGMYLGMAMLIWIVNGDKLPNHKTKTADRIYCLVGSWWRSRLLTTPSTHLDQLLNTNFGWELEVVQTWNLLITGIWGWKWGWTKLNLVPLESSWGGVNRKSNYDVINRIHDFLFTCKVMPWYCKCLFHYAVQFGHWYLCLSLVSYSWLFSVHGLFL